MFRTELVNSTPAEATWATETAAKTAHVVKRVIFSWLLDWLDFSVF
jgi:hypothetical protein